MDENRPLKRIDAWLYRFGGEQHSGWLPPGAAQPLPTPVKDVLLKVCIEADGAGFLLTYESTDGSLAFDSWHETLEEAETEAEHTLGIQSQDWNCNSTDT